jgi:hypothetical protein
MQYLRIRLVTILALLCLALMSASPIAAQGNGQNGQNGRNGQNGQNGQNGRNGGPPLNATPELGSLVLFGSGAGGVAGYALMRLRAGRRHEEDHKTAG